MRTIDWTDGAISLIDQTQLPHQLIVRRVTNLDDLIHDIQRLAVRGAPALGVAGALGVALIAHTIADATERTAAVKHLRDARPTAVNLSWGVDRVSAFLSAGPERVLDEALRVRDEDIAACIAMGNHGADLIGQLVDRQRVRVATICNTGALCAVERGTALGVIQTLFERGKLEEVLPVETRPLLQGSRLTAWELQRMGAPYRLMVDSAAPFLLAQGLADVVVIGADRIAANGDTANKIGSFSLALAALHANIPFLVVAPESTVDLGTENGTRIEIEDRGPDEVLGFAGARTAPPEADALNPAFDVTPHDLITAVITDQRVVRVNQGVGMRGAFQRPLSEQMR